MMVSQSPIINEMMDISDRIALLIPTVHGEFDKEIADLKAARLALDEANTYIGSLADSAKLRADADAYATTTRTKAEDDAERVTSAANDLAAAASAKASGISAREIAVGAREAQVQARSDQLDARENAIADAQTTKDAELVQRDAALTKAESELIAMRKQFAMDRAALNQKLDALRA